MTSQFASKTRVKQVKSSQAMPATPARRSAFTRSVVSPGLASPPHLFSAHKGLAACATSSSVRPYRKRRRAGGPMLPLPWRGRTHHVHGGVPLAFENRVQQNGAEKPWAIQRSNSSGWGSLNRADPPFGAFCDVGWSLDVGYPANGPSVAKPEQGGVRSTSLARGGQGGRVQRGGNEEQGTASQVGRTLEKGDTIRTSKEMGPPASQAMSCQAGIASWF